MHYRDTDAFDKNSKRRFLKWLAKAASPLFVLIIYFRYSSVRETIPDSDFDRVFEEFISSEFSSYQLREPLYWYVGKVAYRLGSDYWLIIQVLDFIALLCLAFALKRFRFPPLLIPLLMISPLFVLGINNIHRQFVGFCAWLALYAFTKNSKLFVRITLLFLPFFIHNSIAALTVIVLMSEAIIRRDFVICWALFLIGLTTIFMLADSGTDLFRVGTQISTSKWQYFLWITLFSPFAIFGFRINPLGLLFFVGMAAVSTALFEMSGGSSGSRFLIMAITFLYIWFLSSVLPYLDTRNGLRPFVILALSAFLVIPSFVNRFTSEIIDAAFEDRAFSVFG